jgi:pimeloyl-ACP methyl ester carboxylesterase
MYPEEMIDIGGRRLHVLRRGHGSPTLVLEAGGASSSAMWWPLQDRLAAFTSVVSYDRAGLGWSDVATLPRSIEDRAADLEAMLIAARIAPPYILVGLSYGGLLIRRYAARNPGQVAGMVFVDIAHEAVFSTAGAQTYLRRVNVTLRIFAGLARIGLLRLFRFRGLSAPPTALPFSMGQKAALASRFPASQSLLAGADEFASMLRIGEAMAGLGAAGSLGNIPVAAISHGKPFPGPFKGLETNHLEGQKQLAALSGNGQLVIAEQSSHAIPVEEPQLVIDVIRRVLEAARDGSRLACTAGVIQ